MNKEVKYMMGGGICGTDHLPKAGPVPDPDQPFPWIYVNQIPKLVHILKPAFYYLKYIDLRFLILILRLYLNSPAHIDLHVIRLTLLFFPQ